MVKGDRGMLSRVAYYVRPSHLRLNLTQAMRRCRYFFHYLTRLRSDARLLALVAASEYFDRKYYLNRYKDVAASGMDPLIHYFDHGADELRRPSDLFDTAFYRETTPELSSTGMNPLVHFLKFGRMTNKPAIRQPSFYRQTSLKKTKVAPQLPPSIYEDAHASTVKRVGRYVVYTAVVGGYDDLPPPKYGPPGADFVVFSDTPINFDGWVVRPLNYQHPDPTRSARFVKLHPHLYFPEYEHSIWIDANIGVQGDVGLFVDKLGDRLVGAIPHPLRECIYEEGVECIARRKDDAAIITRHLESYRTQGVPENLGLWETNVLVRRHNDPDCIKFMAAWWREIQAGSRRDQLSLPVVQRKHSIEIVPLDRQGVSAREHPLVTLVPHRPKRAPADPNIVWPASWARGPALPKPPKTIGICVHNSLPEVKACLPSVIAACGDDDEIVVVDDASDAPTADYLADLAARHSRLRLVRNPQNLGYTRSANSIFRMAHTPWVILLNSDTIVPPKAISKLIQAGEQNAKLAIVGPLSNAASWQSVPRLIGPDGTFQVNVLPRGFTPQDMDAICEQAALPVVQFVPLVNGFCLAIRTAALSEIGFFDEDRFPVGYGEEDDLCLRAADAGFACGIATNTFIFHSKSASFTPERRKGYVAEGLKALREKHSKERLIAASTMMRDHTGLKIVRDRVGILQRRQRAVTK